MDEALALMRRDAAEAPLLLVFLLLPVFIAIFAASRGSRLAVVPLLLFAGQVCLWFAYYATDWVNNPGLGIGLMVAVLPTLSSILIGLTALILWVGPGRRTESRVSSH